MASNHHTVEIDVHTSIGLVRPGDKLVVALSQPVDMATAADIKRGIEQELPGVEVLLIKADALVVYRPPPPPAHDCREATFTGMAEQGHDCRDATFARGL